MLIEKKRPLVSIVISARQEFPNVAHTIHSIINDLTLMGLGYGDFEIILVDNGSEDGTSTFFTYAKSNTTKSGWECSRRGMVYNGTLKILYDPVMGNVSARNRGAEFATGKYLFFCDAHIAIRPHSFERMIKAVDESGGIVHPVIEWMGAYPPVGGFQYSVKIGEKFWGTWNRLAVSVDDWFYIPMSGHCCFCVNREQFIKWGGYNNFFRVYGGGEPYLDLKWWRMGSSAVCEPRALVYHLSAGRGYSYHYDDLMHNMALSAYTVGGMKWAERILITYLDKPSANKDIVWRLYNEAMAEGKEDFDFIEKNAPFSFDQLIYHKGECDGTKCQRSQKPPVPHPMSIWDVRNEEKFGRHLSAIVIFENWLDKLRNPEALKIYKESIYQQDGKSLLSSK